MIRVLRSAWSIARFDVSSELRRPVAAVSVMLFGVGSIVVLRLALAGGATVAPSLVAGTLWIVMLYAALLAVTRPIAIEREQGTWDALVLAPVDRTALVLGKLGSSTALMAIVAAILVPLHMLVIGTPPGGAASVAKVALVVASAVLGLAAIGLLVGVMTLRARGRELLGAAMLLPLSLPLLIVAVTLTLHIWGEVDANPLQLSAFLVAYAGVFIAVALAAIPEIVVE